ncbi:lytic transglycosylase [Methylovirgula ligni]|uniref:Transglycosylase-like protein with SLT domain n=1 Tax=Methylovirgula ligni TaxID=569860 RepID=A0A3D9YZT4_9HYPH|nr:transglycosylase SLT domain-containing protein [Methylovirgula ligni]QAY94763.1 lytic transglycosylase [Methylovirgula ligni]REF87338.1 transglycosylase-like protein with SLT domain [Methylovirgula ligni]
MTSQWPRSALLAAAVTLLCSAASATEKPVPALDPLIARYAHRHGVPEHLVRRVIAKESGYNSAALNRRFYGLMQITYVTARGMGYRGAPAGLLDPEVNLTYGVPYLANAYRLSNGNEARALQLYSSGFYYLAKHRHMLGVMRTADSPSLEAPKPVKSASP